LPLIRSLRDQFLLPRVLPWRCASPGTPLGPWAGLNRRRRIFLRLGFHGRLQRWEHQREKWGTEGILGFGGGVELFIGLGQSAASIGTVGVAAVDRAPGSSPPSCFGSR
jgi:hypothetical protein